MLILLNRPSLGVPQHIDQLQKVLFLVVDKLGLGRLEEAADLGEDVFLEGTEYSVVEVARDVVSVLLLEQLKHCRFHVDVGEVLYLAQLRVP